MSPRTSSSDTPDDAPAEDAGTQVEGAPDDAEETPVNPNEGVQQMNEAMDRMNESQAVETPASTYPAGADVPTAENVRRYPELFDDAVKESFGTEELPETDIERQQREMAEQADQAKAESES